MNNILFSSKSNEWGTPFDLFFSLNKTYNFTLDPCASDINHMCDKYYTFYDDGLSKSWKGEKVFINPPYGRCIYKWVEKAYFESLDPNTLCVLLIPSRTDTKYFHDFILPYGDITFLQGRLMFRDLISNKFDRAPFPSLICVFK